MVRAATLAVCLTLPLAPTAQEIIDRVLAVAAGELIMLSDVVAARELALVDAGDGDDPMRSVLDRLIERALILAEVDRYAPPEPDEELVDQAFDLVRARVGDSGALAETLRKTGLEESHLRQWLRQDLRIQAYLDQRFSVTPATDDELARFYQEHADRFTADGVALPLDRVRPLVVQAVNAERRRALVDQWVDGLRRRAEILDVYGAPVPD